MTTRDKKNLIFIAIAIVLMLVVAGVLVFWNQGLINDKIAVKNEKQDPESKKASLAESFQVALQAEVINGIFGGFNPESGSFSLYTYNRLKGKNDISEFSLGDDTFFVNRGEGHESARSLKTDGPASLRTGEPVWVYFLRSETEGESYRALLVQKEGEGEFDTSYPKPSPNQYEIIK